MKSIIIIFVSLALLCSCKIKDIQEFQNETILIISHQEAYEDYIFCLGINKKKDTLMVFAPKQKLKDCNLDKIKSVSLNGLKKVKYLKVNRKKIIHFKYKIVDLNGKYNILSGNGKPGDKNEYVYSYSSYPFVINTCNSLNK